MKDCEAISFMGYACRKSPICAWLDDLRQYGNGQVLPTDEQALERIKGCVCAQLYIQELNKLREKQNKKK